MSRELELAAARYRLGIATGPELVRAAEDTLLAGTESKHLVLLAGERDPAVSEAGPLFERALEELSVERPDEDEACWVVLRAHMAGIARGDRRPRDGVEAVLSEVYYPHLEQRSEELVGDSHGLEELLGNYFAIDDITERPREVSCEGERGAEAAAKIETHLREIAVKWLEMHDG